MSLSPEILKKIAHIQLKAGFLASDVLVGEYSSAFKGQGMEFDEVREYFVGDDVRNIDWNVSARMNMPFIKTFKEERETTLMVMVDVSASQDFGSYKRSKRELSAEVAAIFASLAIKSNDKVGLILFSDQVELFIPPGKGKNHIWHIVKEVLSFKPSVNHRKTDIAMALGFLMGIQKKKSQVVVISDFLNDKFERTLATARKRHDITAVVTKDVRESDLSAVGVVNVYDLESGKVLSLNAGSAKFREILKKNKETSEGELLTTFKKIKVDSFFVETRSDVVAAIIKFVKWREKRNRV